MKNILDYIKVQNDKATSKNDKLIYNNIDLILEQLKLLLDNEELEGLIFLKNRSPLMNQSHLGYITNYVGSKKYLNQLDQQEIQFSNFHRLKNISQNWDLAEIDTFSTTDVPFRFENEKTFIVSSVKDSDYNWGMLICFGPKGIIWDKHQLKLIKSFSHLICSTLTGNFEQKKQLKHAHQSLSAKNSKTESINKLKERINQRNQKLEKLKAKNRTSNHSQLNSHLNCENSFKKTDETWVSLQLFKKGVNDPIKSVWEKIPNPSRLKFIEEQFFNKYKILEKTA
jgi:hypothetical protein